MNDMMKKIAPYALSILGFIVVCALCFGPQFTGKKLVQHDQIQYQGMSKDIADHQKAYGEDPQWEGNMFSGMPSYLIEFDYSGRYIKQGGEFLYFMGRPAAQIFVAMLAFYIMLLMFGMNAWIAFVPALAYGLSTYFFIIIGAGHVTKMNALAYAPLLIGGIYYTLRRNMYTGSALTALFGALLIGANHPQISYYFLFIICGLWINEGLKAYKNKALTHFAKATGMLALAGALAVGANFSNLWYVNSHTKETTRGGSELSSPVQDKDSRKGLALDYATAWSYGKAETFNLFIPGVMGGSSEGGFAPDGKVADALSKYKARNMATQLPAYWGDQPMTSGPVYLGAVVIFLFVLGLFLLNGWCKWWVAIVTAIAVMLSWGHNMMWFTELFYNYFPLYDKFRVVSMILVVAEWTVPFLGAMVLWKVWDRRYDTPRVLKAVKYALYVTGGVAFFFIFLGLMGPGLVDFSAPVDTQLPEDVAQALREERAGMMAADAFRSLLFVLLTASVVWMFCKQKLGKAAFVALMAALVLLDLAPVNARYLGWKKFVEPSAARIKPTPADLEIMKDKSLGYRVANLGTSPFNDAVTSYFHRSVGGYHGAKLQRYQDIIDRHLSQMNMGVYNMLNTKYFIVPDRNTGALQVQENPEAYGPAWFVEGVERVDGPDQEIEAIGVVDTRRAAVVDKSFDVKTEVEHPGLDTAARITLTNYRVNHLTYEYDSPAEGVAVFSEIYYPKGWTAYVDGEEAPYFRADYILRAMELPAGHHTVEFKFKAPGFKALTAVTTTCSVLILTMAAGALIYIIVAARRKNETTEKDGDRQQ